MTQEVQHLQLSISYFVVRLIVQYISVVCRSSYIQIKSKASSLYTSLRGVVGFIATKMWL